MPCSPRQFANMIRIALFAMLMAVSAPTMSMLLSAACADRVEHCHAAVDDSNGKAHHLMKQCGYCVLQADLPAVPPPADFAVLLPAPPYFVPATPGAVAAPLQPRLAPPSRAPPAA